MPKYYYGVHKPEDSQRDNPGIPNPAPALYYLSVCCLLLVGPLLFPGPPCPPGLYISPIILNTCWMNCTHTCKARGLGN